MPREPPVTSAVRPFNFMSRILLRSLWTRQSSTPPLLVSRDARC
jgi:hypothetical protein